MIEFQSKPIMNTVVGSMNRPRSRLLTHNEMLALLTCIMLMILLGWLCRNRMNPDAVHYLRLASYYVSGNLDLAVSGHWSPLISWLMAPLLGIGIDPLVTARVVVGMSALLFWFGSLFLLKRLGLSSLAVSLGAWCLSFACASWSVDVITPDLLAAGLICIAIRSALADDWISNWKQQCLVGGVWAVAYYAKAVAFPLCILSCIGLTVWQLLLRRGEHAAGIRSLALTLAIFLTLSAPWVILLSIKYHRFTISTAVRMARNMIGPKSTLEVVSWENVPEPGRISRWEAYDCPSVWSPFDSADNAKHQLKLLLRNGCTIQGHFRTFDIYAIGFISLLVVIILAPFKRTPFNEKKWVWSLVPVLSLAAIYWTTYCGDQRFFWVLLPFFLALAFGLAECVVEKVGISKICKYSIFGLIGLSFAYYPLWNCVSIICHLIEQNGVFAHRELARKLSEKQLLGPVVGSNQRSFHCSLYVAYFSNQPWYGHVTPATVTQFFGSKARLLIVNRNEPVAKELLFEDSHFRNLDQDLFRDLHTATQSELQAFELLH